MVELWDKTSMLQREIQTLVVNCTEQYEWTLILIEECQFLGSEQMCHVSNNGILSDQGSNKSRQILHVIQW